MAADIEFRRLGNELEGPKKPSRENDKKLRLKFVRLLLEGIDISLRRRSSEWTHTQE